MCIEECDICGTVAIERQISLCVDGIYRCRRCLDMYMFGKPVDYIREFEKILSESFREVEPINV